MAENEPNKTHLNLILSIINIQCIFITSYSVDHSYKKKDIHGRIVENDLT